MIGLVIISHSADVAEGTLELAKQMASPEQKILALGGTADGDLGNNPPKIRQALLELYPLEGILIFADLGSSVLATEMVMEMLSEDGYDMSKYHIANAPLVEGAVIGAVEASLHNDVLEVKQAVESMSFNKIT